MMLINNVYEFGDLVYLKTDPDQIVRVVVGIIVTPNGDLLYEVSQGVNTSKHYDFEMASEKNLINV